MESKVFRLSYRNNIIASSCLANRIHKHVKGVIKPNVIKEMTKTIIKCMIEDLLMDRTISVKNFGTLGVMTRNKHNGVDVVTKQLRVFPPKRICKFYPQQNFIAIVKEQIEKFKKEIDRTG